MFVNIDEFNSHYNLLKIIENIEFTNREIDVISCILSGRTAAKEIALLLDISTKVVETYKANINLKIKYVANKNIREFIERSKKLALIRDHYFYLSNEFYFRFFLKKLSKALKISNDSKPIVLIYSKDNDSNFLIGNSKQFGIKDYLEILGYDLRLCSLKDIGFDIKNCLKIFLLTEKFLEYVFPNKEKLTNFFDKLANEDSFPSKEASKSDKDFFVSTIDPDQQIFNIIGTDKGVVFKEDYYNSFLKLIKLLCNNDPKIDELFDEFLKNCTNKSNLLSSNAANARIEPKILPISLLEAHKYSKNFFYLFVVFLCTTLFFFFKADFGLNLLLPPRVSIIQDELIIPIKSSLLERPYLIDEISKRLNVINGSEDKVKVVVIVGSGGAGKTTVARYFAKYVSKASVVWEFNSEKKQTLINSMWDLAHTLADTIELKKELEIDHQIQEGEMREKQLINFIKTRLKAKRDWLLIYDNLESFNKINNFFPHNQSQWGNGTIIITTRNENIGGTSYVKPENVIYVNELTITEKRKLFTRILYNVDPENLNIVKKNEVDSFLKKIPPFPLDISLAAYEIRNTGINFEAYTKELEVYDENYIKMQSEFLKEATNYSITRYNIISSSVLSLLELNDNYKDLLLLVCLMNSQNIPFDLLELHSTSLEAENFLYELRKKGIILKNIDHLKYGVQHFSIHRSTQEMICAYLKANLKNQEFEMYLRNTLKKIKDYYANALNNGARPQILELIPHLEAALRTSSLIDIPQNLKNEIEIEISIMLARISVKWSKRLDKAIKYYKLALDKNNEFSFLNKESEAKILKELGSVYESCNNLTESLKSCNKSISICKDLENPELLIAENLQIIGSVYRKYNNFEEALKYLNLSLQTINKDSNRHDLALAEIYTQLGALYISKYLHRKEGKISVEYFSKALQIIEKVKITPCDQARFKWKYARITMFHELDYEKTLKLLREASEICDKDCPEDIYLKGRIYGFIGGSLIRTNKIPDAERALDESINLISKVVGPDVRWVEYIRRAEARIRLGKYDKAYEDCMHVFKINLIEKNNLYELILHVNMYHAGFIQYKLKNYPKSLEHFKLYLENIKKFSKDFLSKQEYEQLSNTQVFTPIKSDPGKELNDIYEYLKRSVEIFNYVYGRDHNFVKYYIVKNYEEISSKSNLNS